MQETPIAKIPNERPVICLECGAQLPGSEALERHQQIVHSRGMEPTTPLPDLPLIPSEWRANRPVTPSNPTRSQGPELGAPAAREPVPEELEPARDRSELREAHPYAASPDDWERVRAGSYAFWTRTRPAGPSDEAGGHRPARGRGAHGRLIQDTSD